MKEIRKEDMLYVIVTHLDQVDSQLPVGSDVYFGVIEEDNEKVKFCALKGHELAGLKYGQLGHIPKETLEGQMKEGLVERMDTKYYVDEFYSEDDKKF